MNHFYHRLCMLSFLPHLVVYSSQQPPSFQIEEIDSLKQAYEILDSADKNSLVIFDIDETLTYPAGTIRQKWFWGKRPPESQDFFNKLDKHIRESSDAGSAERIMSIIYLAEESRTVELQTLNIIRKLQKRGVKIIALTASSTRSVGKIPSMPAWRFDKLKTVGIDFSASFDEKEMPLTKIMTRGRKPLFYKGILITDGGLKGPVLGAFLDAVHFKPNKIIFFDDLAEQVESVKTEAQSRGIEYHGYIYKAADKLPRTFDPVILDLQLEYLLKHDEYINEDQASSLLKKSMFPISS